MNMNIGGYRLRLGQATNTPDNNCQFFTVKSSIDHTVFDSRRQETRNIQKKKTTANIIL